MMMDKVEKAVIDLGGNWPRWGSKHENLYWSVDDGVYDTFFTAGPEGKYRLIGTFPEFMEARARLENKPSWDDAPEWAEWLAQDSDGLWFWASTEPGHFTESPDTEWDVSGCRDFTWATDCGHVFTDWRQSLERRPEQEEEKPVDKIDWSKAPEGAEYAGHQNNGVLRWYKNVDKDYGYHYWSDMFGGWRRNPGNPCAKSLEPRPQPDNKEGEGVEWEPGVDLPPVGTVCEVEREDRAGYVECEVIAHFEQAGGSVAVFTVGKTGGNKTVNYFGESCFRKIQSHRDKVIDAAMKCHTCPEGESLESLFGRLYDEGLLKIPGGEQ